ncbi:MAG TPA: hypothetical protein VGU25_15250 [Acidobacteriaceae bacterium]|nr:hypothetical protein [Acidobacteriaceae bacterium]
MRRAGRIVLRILWISLASVAVLVVLAFGLIRAQEYVFRHRSERLLADFQSIRLHRSKWADAQVLMRRWGAWGHYDGTCTAMECAYRITLENDGLRWMKRLPISAERGYERLARPYDAMVVSFLVQDGAIWRNSIELVVDVAPRKGEDDPGYVMFLVARANDSLGSNLDQENGPRPVMGDEEQLARHPDYKAGRPGACEGCVLAEVTFTPYLAPSTLRELTAYNLSCLTRLVHPCVNLPDVLPIAREWHFYPWTEGGVKTPEKPASVKACDVPLYAVGRDADKVAVVDVLSRGTKKDVYVYPAGDRTDEHETATVQIRSTLKGKAIWPDGAIVKAEPKVYDENEPSEAGEHFQPGKRYIMIAEEAEDRFHFITPWCGVFEDTPEARQELQKGFAENDRLRRTAAAAKLGW